MHSLLILASLLATPAPAAPLPEAPLEAAPLIPERQQLMKGEIARLDPYGGWRDDSRQDPALLTLLREQNRWTE
ncbi:prolyl oligopeptidase family serine peptidase, partial [Aeromonas caviae]